MLNQFFKYFAKDKYKTKYIYTFLWYIYFVITIKTVIKLPFSTNGLVN